MQRLGSGESGDYRSWGGVREYESVDPFPLVKKLRSGPGSNRSRTGSIKNGSWTAGLRIEFD